MEIEFVRNQNRSSVCIRLTEERTCAYECSMLSYHQLPCLLPVNIRYVDEYLCVEYELSGMQPLSSFFQHHRFTEEQIEWLIGSLCEAQAVLLEYMLSPDGLLLEPAYVFIDPLSRHIRFCYQPGERASVEQNVRHVLQYILDHVDYTDQRAVTMAYALYHLEDETGNILGTLKAFIKRTGTYDEEPSVADMDDEGSGLSGEEGMNVRKPRKGFFYRLFHRETKRGLLIEHAAVFEEEME